MHITINPKPNVKDIIPLLLNRVYVTREGQSEVQRLGGCRVAGLVPGCGVCSVCSDMQTGHQLGIGFWNTDFLLLTTNA